VGGDKRNNDVKRSDRNVVILSRRQLRDEDYYKSRKKEECL
jgi:hypothetical protein